MRNSFSRYGRFTQNLPSLGPAKTFFVVPSGSTKYNDTVAMFPADEDGVVRVYTTIDAAIGACVANRGDFIRVIAGHTETVSSAAGIACDIAGVTITGFGNGGDRPTITFDGSDATPSITISAANVKWQNFVFKCNEANQNHMFDLTADDTTFEDCEFREGTATGLSFITADGSDNDCDRLTIRRCRFYCPTNGNYDNAIAIAKDMVGVRIEDCDIYGSFDDAGIHIPANGNACLDLAIRRTRVINLVANTPAISINGTTCTGEIVDCRLGTDTKATALDNGSLRTYNVRWADTTDQVSDSPIFPEVDSASNILGVDDADNGFASTNVVANADGSVLERLEYIQTSVATDSANNFIGVDSANNTASTALVAANKDGSVLERLEDITQELSGTSGISSFPAGAAPANAVSLAEVIRAIYNQTLNSSMNATAINYFTVTADMTSATWNTQASHEIATVTGMVRLRIIPQVTSTLTDAADGASIQLGIEGSTSAIIGSTGAAGAGGNTLSTNEFWIDTSPADVYMNGGSLDLLTVIVGGGLDVGYEITGAALTGGTIIFHIWWEPLDATGAVAAGTGAAL